MKIDFKYLKMMELRSSPGEVLDRVARDGEVFVIERNGQPKACLVPVAFLLPDVAPERLTKEIKALEEKQPGYKLTINEQKELEINCDESVGGEKLVISVVLPHGYPNAAPRIYAAPLSEAAPGRWPDGSLAIFPLLAAWNPKAHNVIHALSAAKSWLKGYANWQRTGEWKGWQGHAHEQ